MMLADYVGRHLQWAHLYVAVDDHGSMTPQWLARSLVDIMVVQLMEHIAASPPRQRGVRHPYWPLPTCGYCGGAIVARRGQKNMRDAAKSKANRWHPGRCARNGYERERKAAVATRARPSTPVA
jgi:hypothetical protein